MCAALNIDSVQDSLTESNNQACLQVAGEGYVNFAFITKNGVPVGPPDPINSTLATFTPDPQKVLLMNPGDTLRVIMNDTPAGFRVEIFDLNTGKRGFMTASIANGFGHPKFEPAAGFCTDLPYAFHPMYATSSEHTRVPWAVHSFNVAFSKRNRPSSSIATASRASVCFARLLTSHRLASPSTIYSTAEYGALLSLNYADPSPPGFFSLFTNFRQILSSNPCKVSEDLIEGARRKMRTTTRLFIVRIK